VLIPKIKEQYSSMNISDEMARLLAVERLNNDTARLNELRELSKSEAVLDDSSVTKAHQTYNGTDYYDFYIPTSLKHVILTGDTTIGFGAFMDCTTLESVLLPESLEVIMPYAFDGCTSLLGIVIPGNVYEIGQYAFNNNISMLTAEIEEAKAGQQKLLQIINRGTFRNCYKLDDFLIPVTIKTVGRYAFENCISLSSIEFPESVTTIDDDAFYGCRSLTEVVVPNTVTKIGYGAFGQCTGLTAMTLPFVGSYKYQVGHDGFENLYGYIFGDGSNRETNSDGSIATEVKNFTPAGKSVAYSYENGLDETLGTPVMMTEAELKAYINANTNAELYGLTDVYSDTNLFRIPTALVKVTVTLDTVIADYAFENVSMLTTFDSETVTSIHNYAFHNCTSLVSMNANGDKVINIHDGLTEIKDHAFDGCSSIVSLVIPASVGNGTEIGSYIFAYCTGLKEIDFQNAIIGECMFSHCTGLEHLTIPNTIETVEDYAFEYCTGLGTKDYGDDDFLEDKLIWENSEDGRATDSVYRKCNIKLENKVIGTGMFRHCYGIKVMNIPDNIEEVGYGAFDACMSLLSIRIPFAGKQRLSVTTSLNSDGETYTAVQNSMGKEYLFGWIFGETLENLDTLEFEQTDTEYIVKQCYYMTTKTGNLTADEIPFTSECKKDLGVDENGFFTFRIPNCLNQVYISDNCDVIGHGAFMFNKNVETFHVPKGNVYIGMYAFYMSGINSLDLPESNISIGDGAFQGTDLVEIIIKNGIISPYQFADSTKLVKVTILSKIINIGEGAFAGCTALEELVLPFVGKNYNDRAGLSATDKHLGYLFGSITEADGSPVEGTYKVEQHYSTTQTRAYYIPKTLKKVEITNDTQISMGAFEGCESIECVILPEYRVLNDQKLPFTTIGAYAFANCLKLKGAHYRYEANDNGAAGTVVNHYDYYARYNNLNELAATYRVFTYVDSVDEKYHVRGPEIVLNPGEEEPSISEYPEYVKVEQSDGTFKYYETTETAYETLEDLLAAQEKTKDIAYDIHEENGAEYIYEPSKKYITLYDLQVAYGEQVVYFRVENEELYDENTIQYLRIPTYTSTIGNYAFANCKALETVLFMGTSTLPTNDMGNKWIFEGEEVDMLTSMSNSVFRHCSSLANLVWGYDNLEYDNGFVNNSYGIKFDSHIASLGEYSFYNTGGTTVTIHEGIEDIATHAFASSAKVQEIELENTLIGAHMFDNCDTLEEVTIPEQITTVGNYAFANCDMLTRVDVQNAIIGNYMFYKCSKLKNVDTDYISDNGVKYTEDLAEIGYGAFGGCSNLESMTLPFVGKSASSNDTFEGLFGYIFGHTQVAGSYAAKQTYTLGAVSKTVPVCKNDICTTETISASGVQNGFTFYIPTKLKRLHITTITSLGFGCLMDVQIASISWDDITEIGDYSFYDADGVQYINSGSNLINEILIDDVTAVGNYAFAHMDRIDKVTLPVSLSDASQIGDYVFAYNKELDEIDIQNKILGDHMFDSCATLEEITIPEAVDTIGTHAFANCPTLYVLN
ncbi:MAG: leucine-rich repeat domain-containing protein, partial [Anaeroplasmataceae bacterium]|nr:leucine-rich repeat domain-containing protein [Anaeroplasmataceae bacterium]